MQLSAEKAVQTTWARWEHLIDAYADSQPKRPWERDGVRNMRVKNENIMLF